MAGCIATDPANQLCNEAIIAVSCHEFSWAELKGTVCKYIHTCILDCIILNYIYNVYIAAAIVSSLAFVAFMETALYIIVLHIPGRLTRPMKKQTPIQTLTTDPKVND